jgi:hypothetical protein
MIVKHTERVQLYQKYNLTINTITRQQPLSHSVAVTRGQQEDNFNSSC